MRELLLTLGSAALVVGMIGCRSDHRLTADSIAVFVPDKTSSAFKLRSIDGRLLTLRVGPSRGVPVAGDWDGDGHDGVGFFDPDSDTFALSDDFGEEVPQFSRFVSGWSCAACLPVRGDWSGSGRDGVGLYDAARGLFLLRDRAESSAPVRTVAFGEAGRPLLPIAGKFSDCREEQLGLYDSSSATFHIRSCHGDEPQYVFQFGPPGGLPIAGRWDADPRDGVGVFEPASGRLWLRFEASGGAPDLARRFFRAPAVPLAGRWRFDSP